MKVTIDSEKKYVETFHNLLKDTPNIKKYLLEQKRLNPNGYRPIILNMINFFKKIRKMVAK